MTGLAANRTIVIDPGHGGDAAAGGSSPTRYLGGDGLDEKSLALDLAQRVKRRLPELDVRLTRDDDRNVPLAERARQACEARAAMFISLHWSPDETRAFVARGADAPAQRLAQRLLAATGNRSVFEERDLGVLIPSRHAPETRAVLLELGLPGDGEIEQDRFRESLAAAVADAIRAESQPPSGALDIVGAGRAEADCPLLNAHSRERGNLILRWNAPPASRETIDVLVHLHGFSGRPFSLRRKEQTSGADFTPPSGSAGTGRSRPTLALIPRGFNKGPVPDDPQTDAYDFRALTANSAVAFNQLIDWGLNWFGTTQLQQPSGSLRRQRVILSCHSGGGNSLPGILPHVNPDELHLFDCLYHEPVQLAAWARQHIGRDASALGGKARGEWATHMLEAGSTLRAVFTGHQQRRNTILHDAIYCALAAIGDAALRSFLGRYYRVERTAVPHGDVPRTFGFTLLGDASADLTPAPQRLPAPAAACAPRAGAKSLQTTPGPNLIPPQRPAGAIDGEAFCRSRIWGTRTPAAWTDRENAIFDEMKAGNMPLFLRGWKNVDVNFDERDGTHHTGTYKVTPDYLAIGSDSDFVRMPVDGITAQRLMDEFKCLIPTKRMVDQIYARADLKIAAIPRGYWKPEMGGGIRQAATESYLEHDRAIRSARGPQPHILTLLIAGHKKDVILTNGLHAAPTPRVAIYGFFTSAGKPIQPRSTKHEVTYSDYSHGLRLVHPSMTVDGREMLVKDVLAHAVLHQLLSDERITNPRIPGKR